jgi:hypothetical protein
MMLLSILRTNWKRKSAAPRLEKSVVVRNVSEAV